MAVREDIAGKMRREDPAAYRIIEEFDRQCAELGCTGVSVTTTPDMTDEEQEMALFEGFLKEGYPTAEAEKKAKEWFALSNKPL
jgi:hypothetical protein